ncbi:MAG TPA: beta-propeller fold lactonase family protein [Acidobacteriaceae bacterium]|jgi:DNA-binding beta-propeller fold protein YncE|nr:beta-propeller fold lactonase family protein [Acidobacteriaceae bacterium]
MKLSPVRRLLAAGATVALGLLMISCGASNTIDFLYVIGNLDNPGQINVYEVNSQSGALYQIADSPYPSGGRNPVYEVSAPNDLSLYVANHDDNTIVQFLIGTDGKLYPVQTVNTPGTEPVAMAINSAGTFLYVLDYYAPAAPGQPSFTDLNPGPGAVIVYPLGSNGNLGTPLTSGGANYWDVQCFPSNLGLTPNGNFLYVANPNTVVVTDAPPVTGTVPILPASCPSSGTVSAFSVSSSGLTPIGTPPPGSVYSDPTALSTGTGSAPTAAIADPSNGLLYVTDGVKNQLYTFDIQSSGALTLGSTLATGTMPMNGTIVAGKFLYVSNFTGGSISQYSLGSGGPSLISTSTSGASGPLCLAVDPNTQRFLYTADYTGGKVGGSELNTSDGTLITNKSSPYTTSGQPTCIAAIPHKGGNAHGLPSP